jgi:antitoxin component YwqK of YwqJK toxin-antitoxin module
MNKKQILKTLILALALITSNIKAQDDSKCGIYIDGTFVDKIDCWAFDHMYLVFPISAEKYKKYDMIEVKIRAITDDGSVSWVKEFTPETFFENFGDAKYGVWKFLTNIKTDKAFYVSNSITGSNVYERKDFTKQPDATYRFSVRGFMSEGWSYDGAGHKVGLYQRGENGGAYLYKSSEIPAPKCKKCPWGEGAVCNLSGNKIELKVEKSLAYKDEFGIIGKGSDKSFGNNSGNLTINNTVVVKNEVSVGTTKTTAGSGAASALKPLDKTKPGYFVEKDGAVIEKEGYKKGDKLNGEMRSYEEGKIREVTFYVNGAKNGLSTLYHDNGGIDMTGNYKNDEKDGEWKKYDEDGKLEQAKKYLNGEVQD